MRGLHVVSLAVLVSAGLATAAALPASAVPNGLTVRRATYWSCQAGYQFQTSGSAVRCYRAAYNQVGRLQPCLIGFHATTDFSGNRDFCAADNPALGQIGAERACSIGFTKRIVTGVDRCLKAIPASSKAPSVGVDR
jgi:hypothetical protein